MSTRRKRIITLGIAGAAAFSACSGDPVASGVEIIEGDLAEQIGLGELDAECDEPGDREAGTEFGCTATTPDGDVIEFTTLFVSEDEISVYTTNVLLDSEMSMVEADAASLLGPEIGEEIDPADIECPSETTVLGSGGTLDCEITDPQTGNRFSLVATFSEHVRGKGFQNRSFEIVEQIG